MAAGDPRRDRGLVFLGIVHGFLVTKVRLQPFIVTLCGFMIYRGLARYIAAMKPRDSAAGNFGPLRQIALRICLRTFPRLSCC